MAFILFSEASGVERGQAAEATTVSPASARESQFLDLQNPAPGLGIPSSIIHPLNQTNISSQWPCALEFTGHVVYIILHLTLSMVWENYLSHSPAKE